MKAPNFQQTDKRHRVLIADDEPWFVQPLRDQLEFEGYQVDNARTGSAALALVRSEDSRPAVLILDVMMNPGELQGAHEEGTRTGLVVLEVIRKELGISATDLPVLCLTIVEDDGLRTRLQQLSANCYFKKDFKVSDIVRRIRSFTNKA